MFQVNDTVLYGTTGVCKIEGLVEKEIARVKKPYYVLRPMAQSNSSLFVPADNEQLLNKMKRILSAEEIHEVIRTAPREAEEWIEDNMQRREAFTAILARGDRRELMQLILTLYCRQQELLAHGKRLHVVDERFMKDAERLLYGEFAVVLQITPEQVAPLIVREIATADAQPLLS